MHLHERLILIRTYCNPHFEDSDISCPNKHTNKLINYAYNKNIKESPHCGHGEEHECLP